MSDSQVKVAIVGAGAMAREHARAFADVPEVSVVGICSRTRSKAEALAAELGIPLVCDDVESLYGETQADLAVVTVSVLSMRQVASEVFRHPWTSLLEKPAGIDLDEAEDLVAEAESCGRRSFVGLNRRHLSSTQAALADLAQHEGPRFIHVQDQESLEDARAYGHPERVVERFMYANSIHLVDYLLAFGRGRVSSVRTMTPWVKDQTPYVVAHVAFDSGDQGLYECVWDGPGPWAVAVTNPHRRWEMRPVEQATVQKRGERTRAEVPVHPWDRDFKPGFRRQAEHAARAARGEPHDLPSVHDALEVMRLIHAIYGV